MAEQEQPAQPQSFGQLLQAARQRKRLSQRKAAERLQVSAVNWNRWERGVRYPTRPYWRRLAEFMGISVEELLTVIEGTDQEARVGGG